ncbi:MAG: DegT/DnrJ/EryC1/StrS family aminotransferase, partial [Rhodobacteraceae bacterium]|nr:DegT/DnrJ/EryC1/StrS family aminotransferase [Paracoccaceae bacterium]
AVIPVHLYGQMVDIAKLRAQVGSDIAIIEDAAHCFEGSLNGDRPGKFSDAAIFSFYATKNITCGEGGCIVTRSDELFEVLGKTTLHGMSAGADRRFSGAMYRHWDMEVLGTKANLPDLLAALLPPQIKTVDIKRDERERLANRYRSAFASLDQIRLVRQIPGAISAEHLFPIAVTPELRDVFLRRLNENNIGATVNYNAVTLTKYYRDKYGFTNSDFPVSVDWGSSTLSLPLFPGLTTDEQDYVIAKIIEITTEISEH